MGILDFVKEAGEALLGGQAQAAEAPAPGPDADEANRNAADAIDAYIKTQNLDATGLTVTFDGASRTVTVFGVAPDQATKEKILLCCGNVKGVEKVDDRMSVSTASAEATFHTGEKGDTLSAIYPARRRSGLFMGGSRQDRGLAGACLHAACGPRRALRNHPIATILALMISGATPASDLPLAPPTLCHSPVRGPAMPARVAR